MKTDLIIVEVDPKEFGLQESKTHNVLNAFMPKIVERDGFIGVYKNVLTMEINEETCRQARELRLKLVKVRTGIDAVHKTQKASILAEGKYIDALKNKHTLPVEQMEENLLAIEQHFENLEKEKLDKIESARKSILLEEFPDVNFGAYDLRNMTPESFQQLFQDQTDLKELRETKAKQEAEEKEKIEAKNTLRETRRKEIFFLAQYVKDFETLDLAELTEEDYKSILDYAKNQKVIADKKLEEIEAENKRLKEESDKKAKEETDRIAKENAVKELQTKRLNELLPFNIVANNKIDLNKLGELTEEDYQRILTNKKVDWQKLQDTNKAATEKAEAEKKAAEDIAAKAQKDLADKKAEEERIAKQKSDEEAAKLKMGDAEKWNELKDRVKNLFVEFEFKSEIYQKRSKLLKNTNAAVMNADINQPLQININ